MTDTYKKVKITDDNENNRNEGSDTVPLATFKSGWTKLSITVEPVFFIIQFALSFTSGVMIDLLEDNVCHQNFNLTFDECKEDLPSDLKSSVEALTADVNMVNNVIQGLVPVLLCLLIGPWSDTNGRKPFMKFAMAGMTLFYFLWGVLSLIPSLPVMSYVLPAIPFSLSGGWVAAMVCMWSYMADLYEENRRPLRLSVLYCCGWAGAVLGNSIATQVFYESGIYGYQVMFFSTAVVTALAFVYITFSLKETVILRENRTSFFEFENVKNIFVALYLRPKHTLLVTVLTTTILFFEITSAAGDGAIIYLVGKSQYSWTLGDYNLYSVVMTVLAALCPVIGLWIFQTQLNWSNYTMLLVFSILTLVSNILKSLSVNQTMFWIAACAYKITAVLGPCIDAEMSNIVHKKDTGKAYALASLAITLAPVVSAPLFTEFYKYLLPDRTLYVFFILVAMLLANSIVSLTLVILSTYYRNRFWNSNADEENEGKTGDKPYDALTP